MTTVEALLVFAVILGLAAFGLRLVSDLERFYVAQVRARIELLEWQASTVRREAEKAAREIKKESEDLEERLRTRIATLMDDLARLRAAGEAGSRFTRFAAERALLQSEIRNVEARLSEASSAGIRKDMAEAIAGRIAELEEIESYRTKLEGSFLLRLSRSVTVALDVALAPIVGGAALLYWAWVL